MTKRLCLAFIIVMVASCFANCVCLSFVGQNSLNYPRHWYNASFDPHSSPDVTIMISASALGNTPIRIMDSDSDRINISILYYTAPEFNEYLRGDNYRVAAYALYDNDWTQGVGADIYVYLPGNASYTINIRNTAAVKNNSIYADGSPLAVNYTRGNLTYWLNDPAHSPPYQASAIDY